MEKKNYTFRAYSRGKMIFEATICCTEEESKEIKIGLREGLRKHHYDPYVLVQAI